MVTDSPEQQSIAVRPPKTRQSPSSNLSVMISEDIDSRGVWDIDVREPSGSTAIWGDVSSITDSSATEERHPEIASATRRNIPTLEHRQLRHYAIREDIRELLPIFWSIVLSKALQSGMVVTRGTIDVEGDPEERTAQPVLRIYVDATPAQTMAFWDSLGIELDRWLERLDSHRRSIAMNDVGLRFHWKPNQRS
ncbi:MAG TPA: hypothetical protein VFR55_13235 [Dehalococcoidia bacterium]|nr:hypothetical protein [Dehalococcoidia bacterium]